jgi:hypothetical protein
MAPKHKHLQMLPANVPARGLSRTAAESCSGISSSPLERGLNADLPPRGLSREQAARYFSIGITLFERLVRERILPGPKRLGGRVVWDRHQLDKAFDVLPNDGDHETDWRFEV